MLVVAITNFALGFILGIIVTVVAAVFYTNGRVKARKQKIEQLMKDLKSSSDVDTSVKDRLNKVQSILDQQMALKFQTEFPQHNALHGKYKNQLVYEMQALEEEKNSILNSILKDGHDPTLAVLDSSTGKVEQIKLSQFMSRNGDGPEPEAPKQTITSKTKQVGKFTVITNDVEPDKPSGGDDNGGGTIH